MATRLAFSLAIAASLLERLAAVAQVGGPVGEPPRRLELGGDVGQLELHRLELRDRLPELRPARVAYAVARSSTAWVRLRDSAAMEMRPTSRVRRNWLEPEVGIAEEVLVGHPHVVEVELAGVEAPPSDAAHLRSHGEAGRVLLDDEAARTAARPPPTARCGPAGSLRRTCRCRRWR